MMMLSYQTQLEIPYYLKGDLHGGTKAGSNLISDIFEPFRASLLFTQETNFQMLLVGLIYLEPDDVRSVEK